MLYPHQVSTTIFSRQNLALDGNQRFEQGTVETQTAPTLKTGNGTIGEDNPAFQALFNASLDGLLIANDQGEYVAANAIACDLFGLPAAAIVGRSIQDFASLELDFQQTWQDFLRQGTAEGEFSLLRGEGDRRLISYTATAHFLPHLHLSVLRDITSKQVKKLALENSENRLRNIVENINDMVFIADQNSLFTYVSPTFKTVMGYELTDLTQRSFAEIVHPEDLHICVSGFEATLQGERVRGLEYRVLHADGQYYWHSANLAPLQEGPDQENVCLGIASFIDDRKQAEIALRESKARLDFLLEGVGDGVWEWNLQTNAVSYSPEWLLLLGCTEEELTHTTADWDSRLHPEDRETAYGVMSAYLQGETEIYESEHRLRHGDGSYKWILSRGKILERDQAGHPLKFIGLFSDITVKKQAQFELEQFFDVGLELLCIADLQGNFRRLNRAWSRSLGYELAELEGKPFLDFIHPDDLESTLGAIAHLGDQNKVTSFVNRYRGKNGNYFYVEWSAAPYENSIYAAARDITARLEAESALKALVQRSQLLNEISTEIRNSLNLETIVQNAVNAIFTEIGVDVCAFGWYREERDPPEWDVVVEQRQPGMKSWLGSYEVTEFPRLFDHVFTNQTYGLDVNETTDEFLKAFCQDVHIDLYFMLPIHTAGGKIGGFEMGRVGRDRPWQPDELELLQNIGNQVAIAIYQAQLYQESQSKSQELEQAYRELQETQIQLIQAEKMSSLGQLVAGIAHEINNPVSFIYGNLTHTANYAHDLLELIDLYQTHYPDPHEEIIELMADVDLEFIARDLPKTLESMQVGAARIRDIIKSLRTFSRLDEAELKETDIHENLDSTLVILQSRTSGRSGAPAIEIVRNYGPLPPVECYGGLLNQVFMNLLANAIDAVNDRHYTINPASDPAYQGRITIHTRLLGGDQVAIAIEDNGVGITPEIQAKIFNPFFTTKPIGTGTGMGLSTSYQIVTNTHRGRLYCTSTLGAGSTFTLELPLRHRPT
ncbi:MAG: PAS domain S-box protein [Spirulina sp. DLM2.Bin59]|nr:MAG: PAS domain S-box protein [Spirulina sp. DLM2.Bin59]